MKLCRHCNRTLPYTEFYPSPAGDGWEARCKQCKADAKLEARYGLPAEELHAAKAAQDYRCRICGRHESEFKRGLHADHLHQNPDGTGPFRGWLCPRCNRVIGLLHDDPELAHAIGDYLINAVEVASYNRKEN